MLVSEGEEVEPRTSGRVFNARLGDPGDRGLATSPGEGDQSPHASTSHGVRDPGNVGAIIRSAHALVGAHRRARSQIAPIPIRPKAVRASMGSIFNQPRWSGREWRRRRGPGWGWSPTGGGPGGSREGAGNPLSRRRAGGVQTAVLAQCDLQVTIPLRPEGCRVVECCSRGGDRL